MQRVWAIYPMFRKCSLNIVLRPLILHNSPFSLVAHSQSYQQVRNRGTGTFTFNESTRSIEATLSRTNEIPVITSYFAQLGAVVVRNLPEDVKIGQAVKFTPKQSVAEVQSLKEARSFQLSSLRGILCGIESIPGSSGQGLVGLIDQVKDPSLLKDSTIDIVAASSINAVGADEIIKNGELRILDFQSFCKIGEQRRFEHRTSTSFKSTIHTGIPYIDMLMPIARGHRAFIQFQSERSFPVSSQLPTICSSQLEDTVVIWVVVGSYQDAEYRYNMLKKVNVESRYPSVLIVPVDSDQLNLYTRFMIPKILSQVLSRSISETGSFKHSVLIFEKFDQYWESVSSDLQAPSVPPQFLTILRSSVSQMMELMSTAGCFLDGTSISILLTANWNSPYSQTNSPIIRSDTTRDFDLLTHDMTDVRIPIYAARIPRRLSPYSPIYQKRLLQKIRRDFAEVVNELSYDKESLESKKALKIFVDDWEIESIAIRESLLHLALDESDDVHQSWNISSQIVLMQACLMGSPILHKPIHQNEIKQCRHSLINYVMNHSNGTTIELINSALQADTVDTSLDQLNDAIKDFWYIWRQH